MNQPAPIVPTNLLARCGAHRRAAAHLCTQIGLNARAAGLLASAADLYSELRRRLIAVREEASTLVGAADRPLALALEREATAGIVACDEILAERAAARAAPKRVVPILGTNRYMRFGRSGDDR